MTNSYNPLQFEFLNMQHITNIQQIDDTGAKAVKITAPYCLIFVYDKYNNLQAIIDKSTAYINYNYQHEFYKYTIDTIRVHFTKVTILHNMYSMISQVLNRLLKLYN